jgi:hypothetical protein
MGWVVNYTPRPLYPGERDLVPVVLAAGWAPGPVGTGAEYLAPPPPAGFDPPTVQPVDRIQVGARFSQTLIYHCMVPQTKEGV